MIVYDNDDDDDDVDDDDDDEDELCCSWGGGRGEADGAEWKPAQQRDKLQLLMSKQVQRRTPLAPDTSSENGSFLSILFTVALADVTGTDRI